MAVELRVIFESEVSGKRTKLFGDAGTASLVIKYREPGKKTFAKVDTDDEERARKMLEELTENILEHAFGDTMEIDDAEEEAPIPTPKKGRKKKAEPEPEPEEEEYEDRSEDGTEGEDEGEEEPEDEPEEKKPRRRRQSTSTSAKPESGRRRRKK